MKKLMIFALCMASNHLSAMTAGQKLIRMVIGDYAKASQQKPQEAKDYDYEVVVEHKDGLQSKKIKETCKNGYVVGDISSTTELIHGSMPYDGAVDSQALRAQILIATCKTKNKVCSPAGMCICTSPDTRIRHELLKRK